MRLGVVLSVYNAKEFLEQCLSSWIQARKELDIKISIVDSLFHSFNGKTSNSNDGTTEILEDYLIDGKIDFFKKLSPNKKEYEARNIAINYLLQQNCDVIISTAPDELFTLEQIKYIYNYIQKDNSICLYYINYNNYIDTKKTYIKGFCPKRLWKINLDNYKFYSLCFDDDAFYINKINNEVKYDSQFKSIIIPNLEVKHYSWLSNDTSIKKINYQLKRWGQCSYIWDEKEKKVKLNEQYYKENNKEMPIIYND